MVQWISRQIWWAMLWFMRRPTMRKVQRQALLFVPEAKREKARVSMVKQEKFARKIGLPLITFVTYLFFVSVALTLILLLILNLIAEGWLTLPTPDSIELERVRAQSPADPVR